MSSPESSQCLHLSKVNVFVTKVESMSSLESSQGFSVVALDSVLYDDKHLRTDCHFTCQILITSICNEHLLETRVNGIIDCFINLGIKACCRFTSFRMRLH